MILNNNYAKNLVTFGICLVVMLVALFGARLVKRRKYKVR